MNAFKLSIEIRERAGRMRDAAFSDSEPLSEEELSNVAELLLSLARIVEGKTIASAFGSPGGWGYGQPIGDALAEKGGAL